MALVEALEERSDAALSDGPVLVVEDDFGVRQVIQWLLEYEGFQVEAAADGEEALALSEHRRPALVILDLNLPALDGEGVATALYTRHGVAVPILVVSSACNRMERASRVRALASLGKPFDIDDLVQAVRSGLRRSRSEPA